MKQFPKISIFVITLICFTNLPAKSAKIISADLVSEDSLIVILDKTGHNLKMNDFSLEPDIKIKKVSILNDSIVIIPYAPFNIKKNYILKLKNVGDKRVRLTRILDSFYSNEPLGCTLFENQTHFALFAPRAFSVQVEIYKYHDSKKWDLVKKIEMIEGTDGVWKGIANENLTGYYYGYRIDGPTGEDEQFNDNILIADPYSLAGATENNYHHRALTYIVRDNFDWAGDTYVSLDYRDLIIYEMHVRDMTAHSSSGLPDSLRGTYTGLISDGYKGGFSALKELGINAVELLPVQDFGNIEIPFNVDVDGIVNTWNPYEGNHWGYMTSYFFAPESYYTKNSNLTPGEWCGIGGNAVHEFKEMVKAFHKENIAVIMDVVYNHSSQYDYNPLKYIDKKYYYNLDSKNDYLSYSGCGNDLNTTRPMLRRLIIDSLKRWVVDFHIDGFRFDLAAMIDWETLDSIREELQSINPDVILIAEPWGGGGYDPAGMSRHGYAAWNDVFRNSVKGQYPVDALGFIFGKYWGGADIEKMKSLITGYLVEDGGFFRESSHNVNYLESHDDHTLGDFIRIGSGERGIDDIIDNPNENNKLSPRQLAIHKLAAMILFTSNGPVMIGEGQEFGRSKVITKSDSPDPNIGLIDHNSYAKDNPTNWINYDFREDNLELVDFYRKLIAFRKGNEFIRRAGRNDYEFFEGSENLSFGFRLRDYSDEYIVFFNGNDRQTSVFTLPGGRLNSQSTFELKSNNSIFAEGNSYYLPPASAIILKFEKN